MLNPLAEQGLLHLFEDNQPPFTKAYEIFFYKGKMYEAMALLNINVNETFLFQG